MRKKIQKFVTLVGAVILMIPNGMSWTWGNMSSYCLSYLVIVCEETSNIRPLWVPSFFFASWILMLTSNNYFNKWVARKWIIILGIILSVLAPFLSYFAIKGNAMLFFATFGILSGAGTGLLYGSALHLVIGVVDKDVGLYSSVLQCSFPLGAVILTELVTWYTNPGNLVPEFRIGEMLYFHQVDIIQRVPPMFLVYGIFCLSFHVLGFMVLQFNPALGHKTISTKDPEKRNLIKIDERRSNDAVQSGQRGDNKDIIEGMNIGGLKDQRILTNDTGINIEDSNANESPRQHVSHSSHLKTATVSQCETSNICQKDYTAIDLLKSPLFYLIWTCVFFGGIPNVLLVNYYKLYGQQWIHDDHFLANMGITIVIASCFLKVLAGMALDRFAFKSCFMLIMSVQTITMSFICFTVMVDKLFYLFIVLFGTIGNSMFIYLVAVTTKLFGKTHISTNFGLLMTSYISLNIIATFATDWAITMIGWLFTFIAAGFSSFFSLILCILKIPNNI